MDSQEFVMDDTVLDALFEYIEGSLHVCSNTFEHTTAWLVSNKFDVELCLAELKKSGAWCDCEVLYDVAGAR